MYVELACVWPGKPRRLPQGRTVITVIVVVALAVVSVVSLSWQDLLAAFIVEVAAGWLLTVLPAPRSRRRRIRS